MKQTVSITGTSSGIGRAAVNEFSGKGWNVAATFRTPAKETEMQAWPGVKLYAHERLWADAGDARSR